MKGKNFSKSIDDIMWESDISYLRQIYDRHKHRSFDMLMKIAYEKGGDQGLSNLTIHVFDFLDIKNKLKDGC